MNWKPGEQLEILESQVADICFEFLKVRPRSDDNFFDVGGTSLMLLAMISKLGLQFNIAIDGGIVVNGSRISDIAKSLASTLSEAART